MIVKDEKFFFSKSTKYYDRMVKWSKHNWLCTVSEKFVLQPFEYTNKLLLFIGMHTAVVTSINAFPMKWTNRIKRCANFMNLANGLWVRNKKKCTRTDRTEEKSVRFNAFRLLYLRVCDGLLDHRNVINIWSNNRNYGLCSTKQYKAKQKQLWGKCMRVNFPTNRHLESACCSILDKQMSTKMMVYEIACIDPISRNIQRLKISD